MKKIVSMLMIFALLLNIGTMVFANNEPVIIKDIAPEGEFSKYLDTSLNRSGSVGIQSVLNISLPVLAFDQHDPEWKDDIVEMGENSEKKNCRNIIIDILFLVFIKILDRIDIYFPINAKTGIIYLFIIVVFIIPISIILGVKLTNSNGN